MAAKKKVAKKTTAKKAAKKTATKGAAVNKMAAAVVDGYSVAQNSLNEFAEGRELSKQEKSARLRALKQKLGDKLLTADEINNPYIVRRPTGIMELDIALGGGFPAGGASMLSGPFNSCKSWVLFKTLAMQQQIYGADFKAALFVGEQAMPFDQAAAAGLKLNLSDEMINQQQQIRIEQGLPEYTDEEVIEKFRSAGPDAGELVVVTGIVGEDVLQTIIECVATKLFSVVALDSIDSLIPSDDVNKALDDSNRLGAHAMMMKKFWLKYSPLVTGGHNYTSLLFVQQVRANMDRGSNPYAPKTVSKGGEATKHWKLIDTEFNSAQKIYQGSGTNRKVIGKHIHYKLTKGKAGTHDNKSGDFAYYYYINNEPYNGVDIHAELVRSAIPRGVISGEGEKLHVLKHDTKQVLFTANNALHLREILTHNFDLELQFRREILAAAGVNCLYR